MTIDYKDLGRKIREQRHHLKLTQAELAEQMGISPSYLGHVERGSRVASLETLVGACNALQVSPEYLLGASLQLNHPYSPQEMPQETRLRLNEFLRLAEDAIKSWNEPS